MEMFRMAFDRKLARACGDWDKLGKSPMYDTVTAWRKVPELHAQLELLVERRQLVGVSGGGKDNRRRVSRAAEWPEARNGIVRPVKVDYQDTSHRR